MLTRLLRTYLRPYAVQVAVVVMLLVAQSVGNLYLPNLNGDIINNGVVTGDVRYIWTTGAVMLAIMLIRAFVRGGPESRRFAGANASLATTTTCSAAAAPTTPCTPASSPRRPLSRPDLAVVTAVVVSARAVQGPPPEHDQTQRHG
jgi:hypothetical protein